MKRLALYATGILMISTPVLAEDIDPEAYIKYREHLMENAKHHTQGIGDILKGKLHLPGNIIHHARALDEIAQMIPSAFPEGSDFGETSAKDNVWSDADGFAAAAKKSREATAALVKAAESGDTQQVGQAMAAVGDSCKGCHQEYRKKK
jgi:cytochrome c556